MMRKFGLIGKSLAHSFSPSYFQEKFKKESIRDTEYRAYEIEDPTDLSWFKKNRFSGLNVTVPYKEDVIPALDEIDEEAAAIGAVNTIKFSDKGLKGYNTDVYGFEISVMKELQSRFPRKAMILGSGGASRAVRYVLDKYGWEYLLVSRSPDGPGYKGLTSGHFLECGIIINTTPVGMYPEIHEFPDIDYNHIGPSHFVYDMIYNPEKTVFLERARTKGATIANGYKMLVLQADRAWEIWNQ